MNPYSKKLPKSTLTTLDSIETTVREKRNSFANNMTRTAFGRRYPSEGHDGFVDLTSDEVALRREDAELRKSGVAI
ncbi:MAG: hypothetical protein ACJAU6_003858 [Alphaproteobacteria bacterium]|jgi:hypothetical protein